MDEIYNLRSHTDTVGNWFNLPTEYSMKQYIIYTMVGLSFTYMVTGEIDRIGRGAEMKSAIIRQQSLII